MDNINVVCIVFQPIGANALFKIPLSEFNNNDVSVDLLNDTELSELKQRINGTSDNNRCVNIIEEFLLHKIYKLNQSEDRRINAVLHAISAGEMNIQRLADIACLGYKQFNRIFNSKIGANPKEYLRIARFQRLHHSVQRHTDMSISELASECGYYDKSHLIQELKSFCGFTPTELMKACDTEYSNNYSLFRSAFVDILPDLSSSI